MNTSGVSDERSNQPTLLTPSLTPTRGSEAMHRERGEGDIEGAATSSPPPLKPFNSPPAPVAALDPDSPWVAAFEPFERGDGPTESIPWLVPFRKAGLARFAAAGLPTTRDEDWRHTGLAALAALPFSPLTPGLGGADAEWADWTDAVPDRARSMRLVFLDGRFVPELSRIADLPAGVSVLPMSTALAAQGEVLRQYLGRFPRSSANPFAFLNDAYFTDGAFVRVPAGAVVEVPIEVVYLSRGALAGRAVLPRNLILAERGSQVTVVESYGGRGNAPTLTVPVTELEAGDGAVVEHLRIQNEAACAVHLGTLLIEGGQGAQVTAHSFALGASLSRQQIQATLAGEGTEVVLNGLYLAGSGQHMDHHLVVDHARPHTTSREYFNGVLSGNARGVFHGRIRVQPGAQKTDAKQTNRNLLLSDQAMVNSKPQLEIHADDVRCTHGATLGPLNPEWLFYLRSRGIPAAAAQRMLVEAFAGEILDRVRWHAGREWLRAAVGRLLEALAPAVAPGRT